jgi:hypothetical protein
MRGIVRSLIIPRETDIFCNIDYGGIPPFPPGTHFRVTENNPPNFPTRNRITEDNKFRETEDMG